MRHLFTGMRPEIERTAGETVPFPRRRTDADEHDLLGEPPRLYRRNSGLLVSAGVLGWAGLPIVGYPGWDIPALAGGALAGGVTYYGGRRAWNRRQQRDLLATTLAPLIGGPARGMVWISNGEDRTVRLSYVAHHQDYDSGWRQRVVAAVSTRLGEPYVLDDFDGPRRRMVLVPARNRPDAQDLRSHEHARFEDAVLHLIGETGEALGAEFDDEGLLTALEVRHSAPVRIAQPGTRRQIERLIAHIQKDRWRAKWELTEDWVRFERRPVLPGSIWLPTDAPPADEDLLANYGDVRFRVGMDEDGNTVEWVPAQLPQTLITGGTGSGKTSTMHALLTEVTRPGWPVWICDGKQIEFLAFRDWPNVQIVATSIEEQVAVIDAAERVMNDRYTLIKKGQAKVSDFEPLTLIIDELAELVQNLLAWYPEVKGGSGSKPPTLKQIGSLLRLARTARIHLVVAMQRPDVALLGGGGAGGGEARSNFGMRMSVGRLDPQGALMMWQNATTGVAIPRGLRQRGMVVGPDGQPIEAQFFRFPDMDAPEGSEQHRLLQQLRPTQSRHPRLVIEVPQPTLDPENGKEITPTFVDYASAQWHLADDRPDLDPLNAAALDPVDGRFAASPISVLGIGRNRVPGESATSEERRAQRHLKAVGEDGTVPTFTSEVDDGDEFYGYEDPQTLGDPLQVLPGDLIELGDGTWGVVDEEPISDPDDESLVLLSWRANTGLDEGTEAVPGDSSITVRRPLEHDEDVEPLIEYDDADD